MKNKPLVIGGLAVMLLALCCAAVSLVAVWQLSAGLNNFVADPGHAPTPPPAASVIAPLAPPPTPTPAPTPAPPPADKPAAAGQASPLPLTTEELLTQAVLPQRDQRLLASRLKHGGQDIPQTVNKPANYQIGDIEAFWVTDNESSPPRQFQVNATLQYIGNHSYWWVQEGMTVDAAQLESSAQRFETVTYPTNHEFFGTEWTPGVDNDPRLHIFMGKVPGVAGYFSAANSYSTLAEPYSNEREMFFINLEAIAPGNDRFDSVLAHEFQHMIHWFEDKNEDTWVNEGLSELASYINGFGPSTFVPAFTRMPETQLNSWSNSPNDSLANYGASFLFMAYFLQRYGEDLTKAVVAAPENGLQGFNTVLAAHHLPERFNDIFADFLVANYLQNPNLADGRWGYRDLTLSPVSATSQHSSYPVEQQATVNQFGADYIELAGSGDLTLNFSGVPTVPVVNTRPHSGQYFWYSHRGDDTNTRLTRSFDLSDVPTATLTYATWFDIESDWDYGYVEISTDGGQTWTILATPNSATSNPSGNAYGPGYTGLSGGETGPVWLTEKIDLTPYAGQPVQIRFEYVTDDAINRPGWLIDDISLPEIGFADNAEDGDNGWQAEGFVRIDNVLPQQFLVQLIEIGSEVTVSKLSLDDANAGSLRLPGLGSTTDRAILVVSGLTPVTTEPAGYQYSLQP